MHPSLQPPVRPPTRLAVQPPPRPGASVRVHCGDTTYVAVFGARPGSMLSSSAARVAEETLHQELTLLSGGPSIQSELEEVAHRVDLALRITHPSGGLLSRGCLTVVVLRPDEMVLAATRTGSVVVVDNSSDVVLATPKATGSISGALGGPLDTPEPSIRLGWARLPPLQPGQRLVVATRDLSVLYSPTELVRSVQRAVTRVARARLQQLAESRGEADMQLTVVDPAEDAILASTARSFSGNTANSFPELLDDPDTIDPLATHHGTVPMVYGRLDRWLIRQSLDRAASFPDITLLGREGWHDLAMADAHTPAAIPPTHLETDGADHSFVGLPAPDTATDWTRGMVLGALLALGALAVAWLVT